ncbi:MAG: glycosyltransferase family 2 protein, partial [Lentisphaeria bacterium]|nr:glycosyltransferase family 2 protein [Lentisphaeria bacterium]
MADKMLSIVIPLYNEEATITELLDRVLAVDLPIDREIIIVNDGSTDDSRGLVEAWQARLPADTGVMVRVIDKPNGGKGSAVRAGIAVSSGDVVIIQDADLEYDPQDYRQCIEPILAGRASVVYGSRERLPENRMHSSLAFYAGGLAVTCWMNLLYGASMTDEPTCYKTFDGPLIRTL